jgi:hypothetical protein
MVNETRRIQTSQRNPRMIVAGDAGGHLHFLSLEE